MRAVVPHIDTHHGCCGIRARTAQHKLITPNSITPPAFRRAQNLRSFALQPSTAPHQIRTMARPVSAMLVLGFLAVAAFCMGEASAVDSKAALLPLHLRLVVNNKCSEAVRVVVDVGNVLDCKAGSVAVLGPVTLKLNLLHKLKLELFVFGKNGNVVKVKAVVDLGLLGTVLGLLTEFVVDVVEVLVAEGKVVKFLCGKVLIAQVRIAV